MLSFLLATALLPNLTPAQLEEDLHVLRQSLEEGHPGIYRYTSKLQMNRAFGATGTHLAQPMTATQLWRSLVPIVGMVKCGHTALTLSPEARTELTEHVPLLPIQIKDIGGRLYVQRGYTDAAKVVVGREIVSINGLSARDIERRMIQVCPGDGDVPTGRRRTLSSGFLFSIWLTNLVGIEAPYSLKTSGAAEPLALRGILLLKLNEMRLAEHAEDRAINTNCELRFDGDIAIMRIRRFVDMADPGAKKNFAAFYKESFTAIAEKKPKALILDLRGNPGGEDEYGRMLYGYLVNKPFKYYDDLRLNKLDFSFKKYTTQMDFMPPREFTKQADGSFIMTSHPNWGTPKPAENPYLGKVIALIDGDCFSTCGEFLSIFWTRHRGQTVGEESGAGITGNNSGPSALVVLPNSKLRLQLPLMRYVMATGKVQNSRRGIPADVPVDYSMEEFLSGHDKAMDVAMTLAL